MIVRRRPASPTLCRVWPLVLPLAWLTLSTAGCDRSPFNQTDRALEQGAQKLAARDFRGAETSYEHALDGSAKSAEAHFRLGILYDENLNNPVGAIHHFRRYLDLAAGGEHARQAKANVARLELTLATSLSGGTLISHAEALRLRTENADLRKELASRPAASDFTLGQAPPAGGGTQAGKAADREARLRLAPGTRTYEVQPGDTFASISRKFYKNKGHAGDIADANKTTVPNAKKLKAGQTLLIP